MDNIAGSPVEGDNFFGRTADVARLREVLIHHDILLLGPRRIGKTSIARAVIQVVRSEGWRAQEVNVASCSDESGFLQKLETALKPELESLLDKAKSGAREVWQGVSGRIKSIKLPGSFGVDLKDAATDSEDWTSVANDLLRLMGQAEQPWLIYIDELPIFLFNLIRSDPQHGVARVRRFLDWFRNDVRQLPQATQIRWLVSGSVGLDTLVQLHGMADTINSFKHESLPAFDDDTAANMLLHLATRYALPLTLADAQSVVSAVQWPQPYYLQRVFFYLRDLVRKHPDRALASLLQPAVDVLAQHGEDNDFHYWEQRLRLQLIPADAQHALALLALSARTPEGQRPETLLDALQQRLPEASPDEAKRQFIQLRDILLRDAYWQTDDSQPIRRYRFRLEPLRRWWLRRDTL